jgi:diacylglycerol kinase (ATP)
VADVVRFVAGRPDVSAVAPVGTSEVATGLRELAAAGVELLVVNGGDGTLQRVLSELLRGEIFPTTPLVAPLRSGRTNMCALDLGTTRKPVRAMERILAAAAEDRVDPLIVERHIMRVAIEPDGVVEYGVFCGLGTIHRAIRLVHSMFPPGRSQGVFGAGIVIGALIMRMISGAGGGTVTPDDLEITIDGKVLRRRPYRLVIASTLDRFFLRLRPFWGEEAAPVRLTTLGRRVLTNPVRVLKAVRGVRPVKPHPDKPIGSYNAHRVEISLDCGLTIDGEMFDPVPGRRLTITAEDVVRFVKA